MSAPRGRRLGQHFLTDRNILRAVADAARVRPGDTVIEVGPGRGALTRLLAERAERVVAVELDAALAEQLRASMPANVEVVHADAREAAPAELLGGAASYKLAANLPYYAALPILRRFIEDAPRPDAVGVLVQLEVAEQLCAQPGDMSLASLGVQLYGKPRIVRRVPPGAFNPPPKVTSAVVSIEVYDAPAEGVDDAPAFFRLARAGFGTRRKQLGNALAGGGLGLTAFEARRLLDWAGIDPTRRAQTLSVAEWAALYRGWRGG